MNGLQLLRHDHDDDRGNHQTPGIANAAEQQDRHQEQRIGEGVIVGRNESADHAEQRAGHADKEITERERGDFPARDVEPEAARRGLIQPQRIEVESDPGALQPPDQDEGADQQQHADHEIAHVERQADLADLDIVIERPAEDFHALDLQSLRTAEHVIDLEKSLQQQGERNRDQRGVMAAGAQDRQQQQRSDQRGDQPADQQHEQMGNSGVRVEHRRGIGADAEERGAGKVQHAGITELDVQSERCDRVEEDGADQQQHEMIFMEERRHREGGSDRHCSQMPPRGRRSCGSPGRAIPANSLPERPRSPTPEGQ